MIRRFDITNYHTSEISLYIPPFPSIQSPKERAIEIAIATAVVSILFVVSSFSSTQMKAGLPYPCHGARLHNISDHQPEDNVKRQLHLIDASIRLQWTASSANKEITPADRTTVTSLHLLGKEIDDDAIAVLVDKQFGLSQISNLNIGLSSITDQGVAKLATSESARKMAMLALSGTSIGDKALECMSGKTSLLSNIRSLLLTNTKVSDHGIEKLSNQESSMSGITTLELAWCQIRDVSAKNISREKSVLGKLTTLNLAGTLVGDSGLWDLANSNSGLRNLQVLDLASTRITDDGIKRLADSGVGLPNLVSLNLEKTEVTESGRRMARKCWPRAVIK